MSHYAVFYASAGCLPDSDEPPTLYSTTREAWASVAVDVECIIDDGEYLEAHTALHSVDRDQTGRLPGPGLYSWSVEAVDVECECAYVPGDSGHEFGCPLR